ncbi:MAG: Dyp-type peroxidase, partial [Acidimicrobiales bacterium]
HLSSVIKVKPGALRRITLPAVLFSLNLIARATATKGELGGIPSIHFAHWSQIDEGRHLLFLSNFDGSWESYLGDFIDKAAIGLTAVWSNTVDFPRTTLLAFKGAADGPRFRQWARAHQCPTAVFYTAYPTCTMATIDNNTSIREGLFANLDEEGTATWLARL